MDLIIENNNSNNNIRCLEKVTKIDYSKQTNNYITWQTLIFSKTKKKPLHKSNFAGDEKKK